MPRKQESEEQRQQRARDAREAGKAPSEVGVTQGASQQRDKQRRGQHPKKKTTKPKR
jgi:hypothetical protein